MFSNKLIYFLCLCSLCDGFKVLLVFPVHGRSHAILGEGYVRNLLNDGHEVTYITPLPIKNPHPRLRQIDISSNASSAIADLWFDIQFLLSDEFNPSDLVLRSMGIEISNLTLSHPNIQTLIEDPDEHFDVVVAEWLNSELCSGFAAVFDCPLIWSSSVEPHWMILELIDECPNVGYTPHFLSHLTLPFTFWERTKQLLRVVQIYFCKWCIYNYENLIFNTIFSHAVAKRGRTLPSLYEARSKGSLVLGNSHVTSGQVIQLPHNYINVGGYYQDDNLKPLPQNFQEIMDNGTDGVIYFSMGTMLKSSRISDDIKQGLLEMFSKLKQIVIWKFEEKLLNVPKNIHITPWAPQQSILGHPNCVLFITHGGLLSIMETLRFGVPIIGVPIYADQFVNVQRAITKGFAKRVDMNKETVRNMEIAIKEILGTSSYRQKAKQLSLIYHDRMTSTGKDLVHWIRHVVNTKGALHLRSPATLFSWYQKMYLDLVVGIFMIIYASIKLLKYIWITIRTSNIFQKKQL